jgi:hypothetical protein
MPYYLPVVVTCPPLGGQFVLLRRTVHPRLEVSATFLALVLQEILIAALTKLEFTDLIAAFSQHDIFFRVASRSLPRLVKTGEQFTVVFDLTVGGSFELGGHNADIGASLIKNQAIIFDN